MATTTMPHIDPHMTVPLSVSLLFHGMIVVLAVVGLPYVKPELPPVVDNSIAVEIVEIDEVAQTDKPPQKTDAVKNEPDKADPQPEDQPPKPVAPQVTAKEPPKLNQPKPPALESEKEKAETPPKPAPVPALKPPAKTADAEPDYKPMLLDDAQAEEQEEEFDSLLRNLMPAEPQPSAGNSEAEKAEEKPSLLAKMSQRVTRSEMDALRQQLSQCWNLQAGAKYAEDQVVNIKLLMNRDRTVKKAVVVDQLRYDTNTHFRAAADAALRAVKNPQCQPLDLPPEKYEQWKEIIFRFDPREMLS